MTARGDGQKWLAFLAFLLMLPGLLWLVRWREQPPALEQGEPEAGKFSATRAMRTVAFLSGEIGHRVSGSTGQAAAAAYLEARLREIPGLDVELQRAEPTDDPLGWGMPAQSPITNVLARRVGRSPAAILVSAHYDSGPETVGAFDNAVAVAAALEVARALASLPRGEASVIFNFNDGEEVGTLGSAAFARHPWMRDVKVLINLDAGGVGGKALLFQVGPNAGTLLDAYARGARWPFGTVMAQDVFQSNLVPSGTDYSVYLSRAPISGVDLAFYDNGYLYHTALDTPGRATPESVQHLGENVLGIVLALAERPLPEVSQDSRPFVFFDVLGLFFVHYPASAAWGISLASALLWAGALVVHRRRSGFPYRRALVGALKVLLGVGLGVGTAVGAGAVLGLLLRRTMSWYGHPELGIATFSALALLGPLLAHHSAWRMEPESRVRGTWELATGVVLVAVVLSLLAAVLGLGSGYLPAATALPGALALLCAALRPRLFSPLLVVGWIPGSVLLAQAASLLWAVFIPIAGRTPGELPLDPVIAALVALPALGMSALLLPVIFRQGLPRHTSLGLAVLGLLLLVILGARHPFTEARPKRLEGVHRCTPRGCELRFQDADATTLGPAFASFQEARREDIPYGGDPWEAGERVMLPAGGLPFEAPRIQLEESRPEESSRAVTLLIQAPGASSVDLRVPRDALLGWSVTEGLPTLPPGYTEYVTRRVAPPSDGWRVTLKLRAGSSSRVIVVARFSGSMPALEAALARMPMWTTTSGRMEWWQELTL